MGRVQKRYLSDFHAPYLERDGLKFGDILQVRPPTGATRTVKLQRTQFRIKLGVSERFELRGDHWHFPRFDYPLGEFELELVGSSEGHRYDLENQGRYLLRSLGQASFRLNGAPCFEAFIQRGDKIQIGHNQLDAQKPDRFSSKQESSLKGELSPELVSSKLNIVLTGESGTGKSRLAREIHESSGRAGEFVHINLSSFSQSLIESELFGHVKGAFTGAHCEKKGAFRQAHLGTLFIDEIDSLPWDLQTKLLLFLEDGHVRPVGAEENVLSDARLIFASGANLSVLVAQKKMRSDFYFRLSSGAQAKLTPLRESPCLTERICREFECANHVVISYRLLKFYQRQKWPGNIRQLLGHLEKKRVCTKGPRIEYCKLDEVLENGSWNIPLEVSELEIRKLEEVKRVYCTQVYQRLGENIIQASKALGLAPNTLRSTLRRASVA
jgi:DNA-binding NtrC family response regulator